jgi:SPP1 gp7 family putative phage head morphogenesis protein
MPARNLRLDNILTRHQVFVSRLSVGEANKFAKFLKEMDRDLRVKLSGDELTAFRRGRLQALLADVEGMLTEIHRRFRRELRTSLNEIAAHEAGFSSRALSTVVDIESAIPATSQINAAVFSNPMSVRGADGGKLLEAFLKDWSAYEIKAVTGAIRRGVFEGQTNSQIVQVIRGTKAKNYADGLLETTARHARTVVQTAVQHASTTARMETFKENGDIVKGVQWLATLDNRTCPVCGALDLKEFAIDKGPRPPIHPNCRCAITAVLIDLFAALNARSVRPSVGPDGAELQSAGVKYYTWLKQQPAEFQDAAIGPVRAQLLRDGGLSADRFAQLQLDKNFEPITLAEMRLLEPLAFREAGL